ncbi:DUF4468 domain-containing protein [Mucilaginibacter sp.]|uniref:DUF4468 domain-containing protein n=1 Tax=Mucilaginibacter sp. TaxID=1882438 RepID=UPI00262F83D8|nr:DUF4468 domain-containing protein [Mucilaginibacter sp.]MDB4921749.1 hypothetical protein [Mucilaginibacter sp.]
MIKKLIIITLSLLPYLCVAQGDIHPVIMQMRNGKIYFDNTYSLNAGLKKEELFSRAVNWFKGAFQDPDKGAITTDEKKGEISGTGVFKIVTSASGNYYWLRFAINITVHNATYELKAYDFYEKPIEPGISNEYSKIEYRWWDYRQGKPWGAEDKPLFEGMSKDLNEMMASLETTMSK